MTLNLYLFYLTSITFEWILLLLPVHFVNYFLEGGIPRGERRRLRLLCADGTRPGKKYRLRFRVQVKPGRLKPSDFQKRHPRIILAQVLKTYARLT